MAKIHDPAMEVFWLQQHARYELYRSASEYKCSISLETHGTQGQVHPHLEGGTADSPDR